MESDFENVRAVAIWIGLSSEEVLMDQVNKKWSMIQHWVIDGHDEKQPFNRLLDGSDTPLAYLVDSNGTIVDSFLTLEDLFPSRLKEEIENISKPKRPAEVAPAQQKTLG